MVCPGSSAQTDGTKKRGANPKARSLSSLRCSRALRPVLLRDARTIKTPPSPDAKSRGAFRGRKSDKNEIRPAADQAGRVDRRAPLRQGTRKARQRNGPASDPFCGSSSPAGKLDRGGQPGDPHPVGVPPGPRAGELRDVRGRRLHPRLPPARTAYLGLDADRVLVEFNEHFGPPTPTLPGAGPGPAKGGQDRPPAPVSPLPLPPELEVSHRGRRGRHRPPRRCRGLPKLARPRLRAPSRAGT